MSFFEPIDIPGSAEEPEPDDAIEWAPDWLGPPERSIGGVVDFRAALYQDSRLSIWVDRLLVYPNGLLISLELYSVEAEFDGREVSGFFPWALIELEETPWAHREHPNSPDDYFRFGVRYADGRAVTTSTWEEAHGRFDRMMENPPSGTELILMSSGGSGGRGRCSQTIWIWPVPESGSVELLAAWPSAGISEVSLRISEDQIRRAQQEIVDLWPDSPS